MSFPHVFSGNPFQSTLLDAQQKHLGMTSRLKATILEKCPVASITIRFCRLIFHKNNHKKGDSDARENDTKSLLQIQEFCL